jgi:hypothetical protein
MSGDMPQKMLLVCRLNLVRVPNRLALPGLFVICETFSGSSSV